MIISSRRNLSIYSIYKSSELICTIVSTVPFCFILLTVDSRQYEDG